MLAFIHMPKAAGTTLAGVLRRNFGRRHFDTRFFSDRPVFTADDYRRLRMIYPDLLSIAGHGITGTSDLAVAVPGIRYFTFLREPIARLLSQFQFNWNCMTDQERHRWTPDRYFEEVILTEFANVQSRMLAGNNGADAAIAFVNRFDAFVGLTEAYDESLVLFKDWVGGENLDLRYRSVNKTGDVSNALRDAARNRLERDAGFAKAVSEANADDVRLYQFACERYAEQRRSYDGNLQDDVNQFIATLRQDERIPEEQLSSKLFRNLIYKPMRPWLFQRAA